MMNSSQTSGWELLERDRIKRLPVFGKIEFETSRRGSGPFFPVRNDPDLEYCLWDSGKKVKRILQPWIAGEIICASDLQVRD
jgi:hypothetical protein